MGPRSGGRGIFLNSSASFADTTASMGPRSGGRGIKERQIGPLLGILASMGPRSGGRGIVTTTGEIKLIPLSFNGAAAVYPFSPQLQWRRDVVVAEFKSCEGVDIAWVASMGPRSGGRGIHDR